MLIGVPPYAITEPAMADSSNSRAPLANRNLASGA
jgi:hypothetical protein